MQVNKKNSLAKNNVEEKKDHNRLFQKTMRNFEQKTILNKIVFSFSNIAGHMLLLVAQKRI